MTMNTMTTVNRFRTVIATALFGAVASSFVVLPAVADSSDPLQTTVKYEDLNIASPEGAAVLYTRIRRAAKNVCLQSDGDRLDVLQQRDVCINKAILDAVTKVNAPALSAVYASRHGIPQPVVLASGGVR
jgi:UrcA family protein